MSIETFISVEEFLNIKTNFLLEKSVQNYLLTTNWSTLESGSTRDVDSSYTLGTPREFIYRKEFLEECFSDINPNWKDGSLKKLTTLKEIDGRDLFKTED